MASSNSSSKRVFDDGAGAGAGDKFSLGGRGGSVGIAI